MTRFEFNTVLVSIVLAFAISQILTAWGRLIRYRHRIRSPGLYLLGSSFVLIAIVVHWYGLWAYRDAPFERLLETVLVLLPFVASAVPVDAGSVPVRAQRSLVVSQNGLASQVGASMLMNEGNAMDAAVATAFALAVVHPTAGNIGGGGFLLYRSSKGTAVAYDFRETAPARARADMFLRDGQYDRERHHHGHHPTGRGALADLVGQLVDHAA